MTAFAEVIGNVVEKGNKVEVEENTDSDVFSDGSEKAVFSTQNTTNHTFGTDYSLEYLLNQFNVDEYSLYGSCSDQGRLFGHWIRFF